MPRPKTSKAAPAAVAVAAVAVATETAADEEEQPEQVEQVEPVEPAASPASPVASPVSPRYPLMVGRPSDTPFPVFAIYPPLSQAKVKSAGCHAKLFQVWRWTPAPEEKPIGTAPTLEGARALIQAADKTAIPFTLLKSDDPAIVEVWT